MIKISILTKTSLFFLLSFIVSNVGASAANVVGSVKDQNGNALEHAVVTFIGGDQGIINQNTVMPSPVMTQKNIQFTPFVLPIAPGTTVSFPNKDKVRHHVYSFSEIKRFELELYGGDQEKSILFDKEGVVAIGCNIHDNMSAFIYIAKSSNFIVSDENGRASYDNLPAGDYKVVVWHPRMTGSEEDYIQEITVSAEDVVEVSFEVPLKRERKRKRGRGSY